MRPALPPLVGALLLALLSSAPAAAASFPATGKLAIELFPQSLVAIESQGSLAVSVDAPVGGHVGVLSLPASALSTTGLILPETDPAAFPILGMQATVRVPPGALAGGSVGGPGLGGVLPLQGIVKLCLFEACDATSVPANLSIPLAPFGAAGTPSYTSSAVAVTVTGAPWTTGTIAFLTYGSLGPVTATHMGFAHGPASVTSSTAAPSGVLSLVTPTHFRTSIPADYQDFYGFAQLDIHIVPEPGSVVLLGLGVGMLAAGARRRQR